MEQMEDYEVLEPLIRSNYLDLDLLLRCSKNVPMDYLYYELNMGAVFETRLERGCRLALSKNISR